MLFTHRTCVKIQSAVLGLPTTPPESWALRFWLTGKGRPHPLAGGMGYDSYLAANQIFVYLGMKIIF